MGEKGGQGEKREGGGEEEGEGEGPGREERGGKERKGVGRGGREAGTDSDLRPERDCRRRGRRRGCFPAAASSRCTLRCARRRDTGRHLDGGRGARRGQGQGRGMLYWKGAGAGRRGSQERR